MAAWAINRLLVGLFIDPVPESEPKFDVDALTCLIRLVEMVIEDLVLVLMIRTVHTLTHTVSSSPIMSISSSLQTSPLLSIH